MCVLVTCYHKFALMLAAKNSAHDPVGLHAWRLTRQVNMILHHFAVALHGSGVRDDTHFSGEIIQFSLSAFIFAVLSHLIRRPCFSGGLSKPPCAKYSSLFFHSLSPVCVCVCVCVFLRESSQQKDGEGFKVTERTGGQSGLCQQ